jgi:hypothetical protein
MASVTIEQRSIEPRTKTLISLTITVSYDGAQADATILLRPGESAVADDDASIRAEIERLGKALTAAAQSPDVIEG